MRVKYLIFDFDGTLYHTSPGIHEAINVLLGERGYPAVEYKDTLSMIGGGLEAMAEKLLTHTDGALTVDDLIVDFRRIYRGIFKNRSQPYPGSLEFLRSWKGLLAIASNKPQYYLNDIVKNHELKEFSWVSVIGGDSLRERKPHPLPLLHCLEKAQAKTPVTSQETLMIGDGLQDILAAKAAGIPSVGVAYGYTAKERLKEAGATHIVADFAELQTLIDRLQA